jgi:hypothetical protein
MGVRAQNADLDEATRATRATFEAWAAEQVRTQAAAPAPAKRSRGRRRAAAPATNDADDAPVEDAVTTAVAAPARSRRSGSGGGTDRTADDFRREAVLLAGGSLRQLAGQDPAADFRPDLHVCIHSSCLALVREKSRLRRDSPDRHRCTVVRCIFRPAGLPRRALHFSTGVHTRPSLIMAELKKQGVVVSSPQVSMTLKQMGFRPLRKRKKAVAGSVSSAKSGAPKAAVVSVEDLITAKKMAGNLGGTDKAIVVLQALRRFEG